jgi:thiol-disulfide isomerase/thioredoxin
MNVLTALLLMTSLSLVSNALAQDIEPPFGIRHYDTGPAPHFVLANIDGEEFSFESTRGNWVFLHFWASWCGPCKVEMPAIQKLSEMIPDDRLQIVMINTAEDEDTIFEFLASINMNLDSLMDSDGEVTELWQPRGLPTTILIDPRGNVKYQAVGGREWHQPPYSDFLYRLTAD